MKYTYAHKTSDGTRHEAAMEAAFAGYAKDELSVERDIAIDAGEERELRELKQIVNGIREEMRYYLANGNGTPRSFWRRLNERTAHEMQIYERTRRELENETSPETWESKNESLRRIGLRTIANPKEQELGDRPKHRGMCALILRVEL